MSRRTPVRVMLDRMIELRKSTNPFDQSPIKTGLDMDMLGGALNIRKVECRVPGLFNYRGFEIAAKDYQPQKQPEPGKPTAPSTRSLLT